jgi:hypothetical protein
MAMFHVKQWKPACICVILNGLNHFRAQSLGISQNISHLLINE